MRVLILAAGKGTRMKSVLPKVLHTVCGLTLIERTLREVVKLTPERIGVVVGYQADSVRAEIAKLTQQAWLQQTAVEVIEQQQQLGTGDAVKSAAEFVAQAKQGVLIIPGDIPLLNCADLSLLTKSAADLRILSMQLYNPLGYGRIIRDPDANVIAIREEVDCSPEEREIDEVNSSIYMLNPELLLAGIKSLANNNAKGEFYLTDIVEFAEQQGNTIEAICCEDSTSVAGANNQAELSVLEGIRRAELVYQHMLLGVHFQDPETVYLEEDVKLAAGCFIGPNVHLNGRTVVHQDAIIEGTAQIIDSVIHPQARVRFGCVLQGASVGAFSSVGPFAHLRPGSDLEQNVKIGNFVEVKQTRLASGAKASHLTYLGDTEVGAEANVGAGTITCNYDGYSKHKTVIGAGAFIGSNTSLVAPVKIGQNAVIGAGSVITSDVSDNALGISRAKQLEVNDWKSKHKITKAIKKE